MRGGEREIERERETETATYVDVLPLNLTRREMHVMTCKDTEVRVRV